MPSALSPHTEVFECMSRNPAGLWFSRQYVTKLGLSTEATFLFFRKRRAPAASLSSIELPVFINIYVYVLSLLPSGGGEGLGRAGVRPAELPLK